VRRPLAAAAVLAALAGAAGAARAQTAVYFEPPADTAIGAVPGVVTPVEIRVRDSVAASIYGGTLTFYFDTTRVQVVGVLPEPGVGLDSIMDTTRGPGAFAVTATGSILSQTDAPLFQLQLQLKAGATSGTYLWVRSDSMTTVEGSLWSVGSIGKVCHASTVWGDVSGDGKVDSRDALITLSAAVGLPVSGFNLGVGDVDGDGLVNSRDALIMLSYAIGLSTPGARVADGAADACPGLTAPGDSVVFQRNDAPAGLYALGATSVVPAAVPGAAAGVEPRLAPDGRSVAYVCPGAGGMQICRVDADTGGVMQLTDDTLSTDDSPDWSPGGDSIVYIRDGSVVKMGAFGGTPAVVDVQSARDVRWGRDSTKLAYVGLSDGALHIAGTSGGGDAVVTTGFSDIEAARWSPDGDSLAFTRTTDPRLWVVPAAGGTPTIALGLVGLITGGDWSTAGILVSLNKGSGAPSVWFMRGFDAPIFRVTRPATSDAAPSWRRSP